MNQKEQYQEKVTAAAKEWLKENYGAAWRFEDVTIFEAGAQFALDNPPILAEFYLHSDDNYYWTPEAYAEYQKLKQQPDVSELIKALERIVGMCDINKKNHTAQEVYASHIAREALAKYRGEK